MRPNAYHLTVIVPALKPSIQGASKMHIMGLLESVFPLCQHYEPFALAIFSLPLDDYQTPVSTQIINQ